MSSLTGSCVDCGARIWTSATRCRVCCFLQRGPRWKGGYIKSDGYRMISLAVGEPHQREHVVVAERAVGRPLPAGAVVHHVNGIRTDNKPENLVIFQSSNDHLELHRKMRVRAHGGDPWTDRMCCTCGPRPAGAFYLKPSGRWASECKSCNSQRYYRRAKELAADGSVFDESNRLIAPPQTILPTRESGPWNSNADQRPVR